jgi:hypothetical protein
MDPSAGFHTQEHDLDKKFNFKTFYKDVRQGRPVCVWVEKKKVSLTTGFVEHTRHRQELCVSDHFLNANAVMIQTIWKLHRQRRVQSWVTMLAAMLLLGLAKKAIMTLEHLEWEPIIGVWILPRGGCRNNIEDTVKETCQFILDKMRLLAQKVLVPDTQSFRQSNSATSSLMFVATSEFQYHVINEACNTELLSEFKRRSTFAGLPEVDRF